MTQQVLNFGICSNCNHLKSCALRGDGSAVILHCEQHECFTQEDIQAIVGDTDLELGGIISILETIQSKYGYLPRKALAAVSEKTGRSLTDIYGVATFYSAFSLKPRGKHLVSVCQGTACHVRGGDAVARELCKVLGISPGETTPDREFTLESVACLGACALGPIVKIDGAYFSNVSPVMVHGILDDVRQGKVSAGPETASNGKIHLNVNCPRCNHSLMDQEGKLDGYPSVRVTVSFGRKHGWLRLSRLYGSGTIESEYEITMAQTVNFFCPHCHADLMGDADCVDCGARMVSFMVQGGGVAQVCSRRGCRSHRLDLDGVNV